MNEPAPATSLPEIARQLAEVFAAAHALVNRAEIDNREREEATRRVANVLAKADRESAKRVMATRRAAAAAELRAAHSLADELRYQAGARALAAIHQYSGTLAAAAQQLNDRRRAELDALGHSLGQVDQASAMALLTVVRAAEERRELSARHQAEAISAQIKAALGTLPAPPSESAPEARSRRRRRRTRPAQEDPRPASENAGSDVVHLDERRRRRAN
ncbi:MAG: hypothetical protein M3Z13_05620 [Candidatus Dormibacteraeota bacterium]|nr:hypothetical protein [Candidatus Dormibacteraeota bacterium]